MSERNESLEIYTCIREHGPIDVEAISEKTGYHPHLINLIRKPSGKMKGKETKMGEERWNEHDPGKSAMHYGSGHAP